MHALFTITKFNGYKGRFFVPKNVMFYLLYLNKLIQHLNKLFFELDAQLDAHLDAHFLCFLWVIWIGLLYNLCKNRYFLGTYPPPLMLSIQQHVDILQCNEY